MSDNPKRPGLTVKLFYVTAHFQLMQGLKYTILQTQSFNVKEILEVPRTMRLWLPLLSLLIRQWKRPSAQIKRASMYI